MRNPRLSRTLLLAAGLLVPALWACPAQALPRIMPYVQVTVTPNPIDLGTVPQPGAYDSPAVLKVHLAANCNHGGIVISITPLSLVGGGATLGLDRIFVKPPGAPDFLPMTAPIGIAPPGGPIVVDYVLKFRVETTWGDDPGQYAGTIVITCSAAP